MITTKKIFKMYIFHPNQIETADEIIQMMMTFHVMCMVLLAQMQSGKTGTYLKVALDSVKDDNVDNVGDNETYNITFSITSSVNAYSSLSLGSKGL